jgi:hypothetical protein
MMKILEVSVNGIAYLYTGTVLIATVATGCIALASVGTVIAGILGVWR